MKYYVYSNKITSDPNVCLAKVTQQETTSFEELVKKATRRGLTLTDTELKSAIIELTYTIIDELNNGKAVETPFARYRPSISGVFTSKDDTFDSNRHSININCLVGRDIKVDLGNIVLEKVKYTNTNPLIESLLNYSTQEENSILSPGGAAEIKGELLKLDLDDNEQGLFFINGNSTTKAQVIMRNMPSDLIFNIPNTLTAGEFHIEIRNKANKKDQNLKTFLFPYVLTVK
jgi:hypothetical protein